MPRSRTVRAVGNAVRFLLFVLATLAALRFLAGSVTSHGWGPAALFGVLLVTGAISLSWRSARDLRRALVRLKS